MKKGLKLSILALLMLVLIVPILSQAVVANAATNPSLSLTKLTLIGEGATSTLKVKGTTASKVKRMTWYTMNDKVAIVGAKTGFVTAVGKGSTQVRVKITYKDGSVKRLKCKVTVQIPSKSVEITNSKDIAENNNRHTLMVGESYDFDATQVPAGTTDTVFWYTLDHNNKVNTEYATVDKDGFLIAKKAGLIILEARSAANEKGASTTEITDRIFIDIINKQAKVVSTNLVDTNTLTITFSQAMKEEQLVGKNKKLNDNVSIIPKVDEKGATAQPLGDLTASLSTDGKVLTIKSTNIFNGLYGIATSNLLEAKDGTKVYQYNENIKLYDTTKPYYTGFTQDETGLIVTLNFSEPLNFTYFTISDPKVLNTSSKDTSSFYTALSIIGNQYNYIVSEDKKSLTIDLSLLPTLDQNRTFSVNIGGIKDLAGNDPVTYPLTVAFKADTSPKDQAKIIGIVRTGYNTLTATFTRPIQYPGYAMLGNGDTIPGVVDIKERTKVNYTLSSYAAILSGMQEVGLAYFDSYNVKTTDTSAQTVQKRQVNFTVTKDLPVLTAYELKEVYDNNIESYVLQLTYSKDVTISSQTGFLTTTVKGTNGNINSSHVLSYSAIVEKNIVKLILNKDEITQAGLYEVKMPSMFVFDNFMNQSAESVVRFIRQASASSALPAPTVSQSTSDPSIVYVTFRNKVDIESAQKLTNYTIVGTTVIGAQVIDNSDLGATIELKLAAGSITSTMAYPIYINGVAGYHNTYTEMEQFSSMISLRKNKQAQIVHSEFKYPMTIELYFDENIKGTGHFQVMNENSDIFSYATITDNKILITLRTLPKANTVLQIIPTQYNDVYDVNNAKVTIGTRTIIAKY